MGRLIMYRKKSSLIGSFFLLSIFAWAVFTGAQINLQYQDRGNRKEGIKPKPVSGFDIELISVLADFKEEVEKIPDQFKLKFYLELQPHSSLALLFPRLLTVEGSYPQS